jgi:hypothetical protein
LDLSIKDNQSLDLKYNLSIISKISIKYFTALNIISWFGDNVLSENRAMVLMDELF